MPKASVYRCVTFKCCDGAPIKPSFMSNSEFGIQPHETCLYKCADQCHSYVHQLANDGWFQLNQQLPQNLHAIAVDWWYAVCLSVGYITITCHFVEWFSQMYLPFGCQYKITSSQKTLLTGLKYIHGAHHSDWSSLNLLSHSLTS
jgi:hypothetical protein